MANPDSKIYAKSFNSNACNDKTCWKCLILQRLEILHNVYENILHQNI